MALTFLNLPAEIRMMIYHQVFPIVFRICPRTHTSKSSMVDDSPQHSALLEVCRQTHDEAAPVLYGNIYCQRQRQIHDPSFLSSRYTKFIREASIDHFSFSTIPREEPDPSSAYFLSPCWLLNGFPNLQRCTVACDGQGILRAGHSRGNAAWLRGELRKMQKGLSGHGRLFNFHLFLMFSAVESLMIKVSQSIHTNPNGSIVFGFVWG
jgi:2EXR family